MKQRLISIAQQFAGDQPILNISTLGNGLINDTYQVRCADTQFVLQRINHLVFNNPEAVMANLQQLQQHLARLNSDSIKLKLPATLLNQQQTSLYQDPQQQYWRALELISPSESREQLSNDQEAEQVGFALGHFHRLCSELPIEQLHDTLPGFHITPSYFASYQSLYQQISINHDCAQQQACHTFIDSHAAQIQVLEQAKQQGELKQRVIHGDPKLNNFLFKPDTNQIISLIDLDTVKPGLVHYDIGDCLRSCCHRSVDNQFDLQRCEIILKSYLREAGHFFSEADYHYLYPAIWLIPFELGLRFFSDHLNGNRYFKTSYARQNLDRATAQFELCQAIEDQQTAIKQLIQQLRTH